MRIELGPGLVQGCAAGLDIVFQAACGWSPLLRSSLKLDTAFALAFCTQRASGFEKKLPDCPWVLFLETKPEPCVACSPRRG